MEIKRKPIVGETLYLVHGVDPRYPRGENVVVKSVGRKYFVVRSENWRRDWEFHLDTWKHHSDYSHHFDLYESKESYDAIMEKAFRNYTMRKFFRTDNWESKLTEEQIDTIYAIIVEVSTKEVQS